MYRAYCIAYAVAAAKEQIEGHLESIHVQVDSNIYKNGLMVTIPGTTEKGLVAAAAFGFIAGDIKRRFRVGFIAGDIKRRFRVIEGLTDVDIDVDIIEARRLIKQKKVELSLKKDCIGLDIEVTLFTDREKVRVNILESHLNIVNIEKTDLNSQFKPLIRKEQKINSSHSSKKRRKKVKNLKNAF